MSAKSRWPAVVKEWASSNCVINESAICIDYDLYDNFAKWQSLNYRGIEDLTRLQLIKILKNYCGVKRITERKLSGITLK